MLQSSLGQMKIRDVSRFDHFNVAVITSTKEFDEKGRIDVQFNTGGVPVPVQIVENLGTNVPEQGDWVVIGYAHGTKHQPFFVGYVKDLYRTSDILRLSKDFLEVKYPIEFDDETHEKKFEHFVLRIEMPDPNSEEPLTPKVTIQMPESMDGDPTRITMENEIIKVESAGNIEVIAKGELIGYVEKDVNLQTKGNLMAVIDGDAEVNIGGGLTALVDGSAEVNVGGDLQGQVSGSMTLKSGGSANIEAGGALTLKGSVINLN